MDKKELNDVLEKHSMWLKDSSKGKPANLRYADLRYADLRDADLLYADLRYANLSYANLFYADLLYADLRYADLRDADLRYADLRDADLSYADLRYANLRYADLRDADFDSSVFPLWCGSFDVKNADRLVKQLLSHIARMNVEDKELKKFIDSIPLDFVNDICHRHPNIVKELKKEDADVEA